MKDDVDSEVLHEGVTNEKYVKAIMKCL